MRHSTRGRSHFRVRLACVKHAASVQSEPESNSPVQICTKIPAWQKSESQSSISTRSSLVNEPEKEFFTPPFFAAFVNMLFCHRSVNNFFRNLQKTLCESFSKPRCFTAAKVAFTLIPHACQQLFSLFPGNLLPGTFREALSSGGDALNSLCLHRCQEQITFFVNYPQPNALGV